MKHAGEHEAGRARARAPHAELAPSSAAPHGARARGLGLSALAMAAFASNSILCRAALQRAHVDPASFTSLRIGSGALVLAGIAQLPALRRRRAASGAAGRLGGNWISAAALCAYALLFSLAYVRIPAGSGALLLFGAVQVTMIGRGLASGERLHAAQLAGLALALGGLVALLWPGVSAPPGLAALSMLAAGVAWGVYSLRGRAAGDATHATAGNFARALPLALVASAFAWRDIHCDATGAACALASGALASGLGYAIWYAALRGLRATEAAVVQLSVPVLVGLGGIALLGEAPTLRLALAGAAILGGIALVLGARAR